MSDRRSIDTTSIVCISGFLTVLLAIPAPFILGLFKEGYNPIHLTISELGETEAPTALAATILFAAIGICEILFAAALALRFKLKAAALVGSIFMAVNGLFDYVGSAIFPIDAGGLFESPSGRMHFLVSVIGMSVMIFPAFFYARAMKKEGMAKESRATFAFACAIVGTAALFNLSFFTETLVGLAQRVVDLAYFGWILYVSVVLFPKRATTA